MRPLVVLLLALGLGLACARAGHAQQDSPQQRESLRGLAAVQVVVPAFANAALDSQFNAADMQARLAVRLHDDGIRVRDSAETSRDPRQPVLTMEITCADVRAGAELTALAVNVEFHVSQVLRPRGHGSHGHGVVAITWRTQRLFLAIPGEGFREDVLENADEMLDEFMGAWLTSHPAREHGRR